VAIAVRGLRKVYGDYEAVRGIDFTVEEGEAVAFLGPNGAGKTTTVEVLEGYRAPTAGEVEVLRLSPTRDAKILHRRTGIVLQQAGFPPELTASDDLCPRPRGRLTRGDRLGAVERAGSRGVQRRAAEPRGHLLVARRGGRRTFGRRRRMSASQAALAGAQLRLEQKLFWRNRQSAVFSFGLPVVFVILFGLLFQGNGTVGTGGVPYTA
jgi:ABC-2 type transport system ATP-binding protein